MAAPGTLLVIKSDRAKGTFETFIRIAAGGEINVDRYEIEIFEEHENADKQHDCHRCHCISQPRAFAKVESERAEIGNGDIREQDDDI